MERGGKQFMRVDLIEFKREELYVNIKDRIELCVDGRWYDIIEDFYKPKGNALQNIRILDKKLLRYGGDTTVINISDILKIPGGRKGISMKAVLTKLLNNFKEVVRDDAEMYYNHIKAILEFLEGFHEGKRQAMLMNLDDETAKTWQDVIGNL